MNTTRKHPGTTSRRLARREPIRLDASRQAAFTLVEIMVVVIVLAILAATIIPQFGSTTHDAKVTRARADIKILENAVERFSLRMDRYPTTAEGLEALVKAPSGAEKQWGKAYIGELRPDPWGNAYRYRSPGIHGAKTYDIWSQGADGADGGEERDRDIGNWAETSTSP